MRLVPLVLPESRSIFVAVEGWSCAVTKARKSSSAKIDASVVAAQSDACGIVGSSMGLLGEKHGKGKGSCQNMQWSKSNPVSAIARTSPDPFSPILEVGRTGAVRENSVEPPVISRDEA